MIFIEKYNYKSCGGIKKQLEILLCDSLKYRISYFYTTYREVRKAYGRASINYDKKELVSFSWDIGYQQWDDEYKFLNDKNIDASHFPNAEDMWQKQLEVQRNLAKEKWMPNGTLCETDFIYSASAYVNTDIAEALESENYLLRVFAFMDRRVGKRTLIKIKEETESLPDWARKFYDLRLKAEGMAD